MACHWYMPPTDLPCVTAAEGRQPGRHQEDLYDHLGGSFLMHSVPHCWIHALVAGLQDDRQLHSAAAVQQRCKACLRVQYLKYTATGTDTATCSDNGCSCLCCPGQVRRMLSSSNAWPFAPNSSHQRHLCPPTKVAVVVTEHITG